MIQSELLFVLLNIVQVFFYICEFFLILLVSLSSFLFVYLVLVYVN